MSAREERILTPKTIAAVDQWLDGADVFAKGYWQYVDGKLTTVGLRIGQDWDKVVAFFGDTIVRHEDGSHTVLSAKDAAEVARLREERHSTNEALSDAAETIRAQRDRIAELEAHLGRDAEQRHLMDPLDHALEALAPRSVPAIPHQLDRRAL